MLDDRQIQALMHDAEEKVPSRVWSAVSSRLEPAAPVIAPVWKWAGIGFAVAAAIVAGIFFTGTSSRQDAPAGELVAQVRTTPDIHKARKVTEIAPVAKERPVVEKKVPTLKEAASVKEAPAVKKAPVSVKSQKTEVAPKATMGQKPSAEREVTAEHKAPVKEAPAPAPRSATDDAPVSDPFIGIEDEPVHSAGRAQLSFSGAVGGNVSNSLGASSMSSGSPVAPATDVITETSNSSHGIPFTVGLGVRFQIAPKLMLGTGIDYSLLTRTFNGTFTPAGSMTSDPGEVRNSLHYIGIPVRLYYNIVDNKALKFYAYAGGEAEWCVSDKFQFRPDAGGDPIVLKESVKSPQFSIGTGVGVQFRLSDKLGLYLDPGVNYYFYGSQPKSIRTERPLMFNFNAGLRFDL